MNTICSGLYSQVHANTDKVPACSSRLGVLCLLDWLACKRLPAAPGQLAWASSVGGWVHPLACYAMFARTSAAFGSSWHTHEVITFPPPPLGGAFVSWRWQSEACPGPKVHPAPVLLILSELLLYVPLITHAVMTIMTHSSCLRRLPRTHASIRCIRTCCVAQTGSKADVCGGLPLACP